MKSSQPPAPKTRARPAILNFIAQLTLQRPWGGHSGLQWERNDDPPVGSLVALQAAPASKWYLSWVVSTKTGSSQFMNKYLLESIEDGSLCEWGNVGLLVLPAEHTSAQWRWTDKQYAFNDRWRRACHRHRDAYMYLPVDTTFDGDVVTLRVRARHGLDSRIISRQFPNWRKVRVADMLDFYDHAAEQYRTRPTETETNQ